MTPTSIRTTPQRDDADHPPTARSALGTNWTGDTTERCRNSAGCAPGADEPRSNPNAERCEMRPHTGRDGAPRSCRSGLDEASVRTAIVVGLLQIG